MKYLDNIRALLFGVATGDALGVPVEFISREELKKDPVTGMRGYGTHNQPPGTWSDDTSLTLCLAEALTQGFDLKAASENFVKWCFAGYWSANGTVFDVGGTTYEALYRLKKETKPHLAGSNDEYSNGNGSLMRISPLVFYLLDKPAGERFEKTQLVSSITHRHIRSVIACFYYLEFARQILAGENVFDVYRNLQKEIPGFLSGKGIDSAEISKFDRLLKMNIYELPEEDIYSSGYVVHTLEAAVWCLLTSNSFSDAVLKAVNLGEDTDSTGAVTGGLAGLLYGIDSIPKKWLNKIARHNDIEDLAERLAKKLS
jgi:ADP-ribosylglycohydrolase